MADLTIVTLSGEPQTRGPVEGNRSAFCELRTVAVPLSLRARLAPQPEADALRKRRRAAV